MFLYTGPYKVMSRMNMVKRETIATKLSGLQVTTLACSCEYS